MGDIAELASSIHRFGLLHPPVVDEALTLVAGERRLRACQSLGWTAIEVRRLGELSEAERREIEVEANVRRKDLTPIERSRTLVALAKTAAEVDRESFGRSLAETREGRPEEPGSDRRVADRIGVPRQTIQSARAHVAAAERYPELAAFTQADALAAAKRLDALPEPERERARAGVRAQSPLALAQVAGRPPIRRPLSYRRTWASRWPGGRAGRCATARRRRSRTRRPQSRPSR